MRVAFSLPALDLFGGVGVVVGHAARLRAAHRIDAVLVLARADGSAVRHDHAGLDDVPVLDLDEARTAEPFDVAVATWWETTLSLHDLPAARYAYFVQSMEDRFYAPHSAQRAAAAMTHGLPLSQLTEARWIADELGELRRDRTTWPVHYVRNGIDKETFCIPDEPSPSLDGPLRVTIEGSPAAPSKGVREALAACAAARVPLHVCLVCGDADTPADVVADEIVGPLSPSEMAERLARTDVVLKLSRVEGMAAPPLEGFHCGATCISTPVTGHDEYIEDGVNALLTGWDDPQGTAQLLDLLSRDRAFLHRLRVGALHTARNWPSIGQSTALLALALDAIARAPSQDPAGAAAGMAAEIRNGMHGQDAQLREHERLQVRMDRVDRLLARGPLRAARRIATWRP